MKNKNTPPVILLNMAVDVINGKENEVIISKYVERVSESGAVPMLIPSIEKEQNIETLLDLADGVVFIGGRDYDARDFGEEPHPMAGRNRLRPHFDIAFANAVLKRKMPVLGICAGCQLLNIVTGGKLIQHLDNAEEQEVIFLPCKLIFHANAKHSLSVETIVKDEMRILVTSFQRAF